MLERKFVERMLPAALFLLAPFFLLGCSGSKKSESDLNIAGGNAVIAEDPIAKATVSLKFIFEITDSKRNKKLSGSECSGVLIESDIVVTAAHCFDSSLIDDTDSQITAKLRDFSVVFKTKDPNKPLLLKGQFKRHESYNDPYNEPFTFDIAVIKLMTAAPISMKPAFRVQKGDYKVGDRVILAGYGQIKDRKTGKIDSENRNLYAVTTQISSIFTKEDSTQDEVDYGNWGLIRYFSEDGISGACRGDSGGPMFIKKASKLRVIGITVGGYEKECGASGSYTSLEFYSDWLDAAIAELKSLPVI